MSEFYLHANSGEQCQYFSRVLIDSVIIKGNKMSLVKKLTVWQLKVELKRLHNVILYPSVLLLMKNMSQSACEILDSCLNNCFQYQLSCNKHWHNQDQPIFDRWSPPINVTDELQDCRAMLQFTIKSIS